MSDEVEDVPGVQEAKFGPDWSLNQLVLTSGQPVDRYQIVFRYLATGANTIKVSVIRKSTKTTQGRMIARIYNYKDMTTSTLYP